MTAACATPVPVDQLVDYGLGELEPDVEEAVETHLFVCESCARRLETVMAIGHGIRALGQAGGATATVNADLVVHAAGTGRVREYRLEPGEAVACTAGPDDTYVAIRLAGPFGDIPGVDLEVAFEDLDSGARHARRVEDVPVDAGANEVVLLFPGAVVRGYPRSRWTLDARGRRQGTEVRLGPWMLDHTPWERLPR